MSLTQSHQPPPPRTHAGPVAAAPADEDQLRVLVNGVSEYAIFMLDPHGIITNWNRGAERIKGYRAEEVIGKHFSLFYTDEDRAAGIPARALQTAVDKGLYQAQSWRVRKGSIRFMADVLIEALHDPAGRLIGFAKLTRDISERVQQQKALEESRAALARLQKLADLEPINQIAHDLNNLLQVIRNGAELLQRRVQAGDSEAAGLIDVVKRNAESGANLTSDLLKLARRRFAEPAAVNLNELVAGMVESIRQWLGERVTVEAVLAGALWETAADPEQLKTAIVNLVMQARNALPEAGKVTIETGNVTLPNAVVRSDREVVPAGEYVTLAVRDRGTGMSREIVAKALFNAGEDGIMLGMAQVHGLTKQAQGHLTIDSTPGEGTLVTLYFPRLNRNLPGMEPQDAPGTRPPAPEDDEPASARHRSLSGLRVLVIEDEALIALFVEDLLDQLGCTLASVRSTVSDGLEAAQSPDFDLALLDVNVGGEPVYPVAQALQKHGVPVVFMSGYRQMEEGWRTRPSVQKPFDLQRLAAAMERAMRANDAPARVPGGAAQ
jgi:PAS domain S-box-containing protein